MIITAAIWLTSAHYQSPVHEVLRGNISSAQGSRTESASIIVGKSTVHLEGGLPFNALGEELFLSGGEYKKRGEYLSVVGHYRISGRAVCVSLNNWREERCRAIRKITDQTYEWVDADGKSIERFVIVDPSKK